MVDILGIDSSVIAEESVVALDVSSSPPGDFRLGLNGDICIALASISPVESVAAVTEVIVSVDIALREEIIEVRQISLVSVL